MRAYDVSSNAGDTEGTSEALDSLSDAYRKSGDDKKAEEMMKRKPTSKRNTNTITRIRHCW